jgi:hypothetical protein
MLKNITSIEVKRTKDDKELLYQLFCENHSTLGELYDVLCEMRGEILNRLKTYHEAETASAKKEEARAEPVAQEAGPELGQPQEIVVQCPEC